MPERPSKTAIAGRGEANTYAAIARSEAEVGESLRSELAGYFELLPALTDTIGSLIARIRESPGQPKTIHAAALLLARILTELQACAHLVRLGYPVQALTLTGTMLELMHTLAYIGADEKRADEWFSHADPTSSYPGSIKQTIKGVAVKIGADPSVAKREYDEIYRDICMAKHGNPIAFGQTGVIVDGDAIYVMSGPFSAEGTRRAAHAALQYAVRYAILAAIVFSMDHLRGDVAASAFADLDRLSATHRSLVDRSAFLFQATAKD